MKNNNLEQEYRKPQEFKDARVLAMQPHKNPVNNVNNNFIEKESFDNNKLYIGLEVNQALAQQKKEIIEILLEHYSDVPYMANIIISKIKNI